jgi:hypothetical protein
MKSANDRAFQSRWVEEVCFTFIKEDSEEFYRLEYNAV